MIIAVYDSGRLTEECKEYIKSVVGNKKLTFKAVHSPIFLPKKVDYTICLYPEKNGMRCSIYKTIENGSNRFISGKIIKTKGK